MTDISDCRCIACSGPLDQVGVDDGGDFVENLFKCRDCARTFDQVWGVPFLLEYDEADFIGLVEIAANAGQVSHLTPDGLSHFNKLLGDYHRAPDRAAFLVEAGPVYAPWLPIRYTEWEAIERLAGDEIWAGKKILDVGAGLGFDAYRHVAAGADVTAVEYSPVLAREGKRTLPMIRWFGGVSHILPFADASFDAVFCNAALHHMRDLPAAIHEMLRVLRPGGFLITTGDPFRADHDGEDVELAIFDKHPDVLLGVNEQTPRLGSFITSLEQARACIEPRIFTQVLYDGRGLMGHKKTDEFQEWSLDADGKTLRQMAGSLAMKVRLVKPTGQPAATQRTPGMLRAAQAARMMDGQTQAMAALAEWAPAAVVNRKFPGTTPNRFELLNGWQAPVGQAWRQAYRRARWFLKRGEAHDELGFDLQMARPASFEVLLNGVTVNEFSVQADEWRDVTVDLTQAPVGTPFAVEIRLLGEAETFEAGLFRVRNRRFGAVDDSSPAEERIALSVGKATDAGVRKLKSFIRQQLGRQ